jgi:hypothetical protein
MRLPNSPICPGLYEGMVRLSPYAKSQSFGPRSAAFHFASGAPFTRAFMLKKTKELMTAAGIAFVDDLGREYTLELKMTSWRAGGVRSATDANLSPEMIKELGRWKSDAWAAYLLLSCRDLQRASHLMWQSSEIRSGPVGMQVGLFMQCRRCLLRG